MRHDRVTLQRRLNNEVF